MEKYTSAQTHFCVQHSTLRGQVLLYTMSDLSVLHGYEFMRRSSTQVSETHVTQALTMNATTRRLLHDIEM
jgi:hypothetical protein